MACLIIQFIVYTFHWPSFVFSQLVCIKIIVLGESTLVVLNLGMLRKEAPHPHPNYLLNSQPQCEPGTQRGPS